MSRDCRNEATLLVQSNTRAMPNLITPPLEVSPKVNLDSVESTTKATFVSYQFLQNVAQDRPDRSRPTHGDISGQVGKCSASAEVIPATSPDMHVPLMLLLQKLIFSIGRPS